MTGAGRLASSMTEKELMQGLIDAARASSWLIYHVHDSRRSAAGFPDLVLVHPTRGLTAFIECKAAKGRITEAQKDWIAALEHAGQTVGIANPDTYDSWLGYITRAADRPAPVAKVLDFPGASA